MQIREKFALRCNEMYVNRHGHTLQVMVSKKKNREMVE